MNLWHHGGCIGLTITPLKDSILKVVCSHCGKNVWKVLHHCLHCGQPVDLSLKAAKE